MRVIVLIIALFVPVSLTAQLSPDVRLSPEEPFRENLPNAYRIQSAAVIGSRALLVWATSRSIADDAVVGQLRYRILEGIEAAGGESILTTDVARPATYVRVIPLASRFLVLWLDGRADSGGLYSVLVDYDGNVLGAGKRLGPPIVRHAFFGTTAFVSGTPEDGQLICWHINDGERTWTIGVHVDSAGKFSDTMTVGHILQEVQRFDSFPGMAMLHFDSSSVMVHGDGGIDARPVSAGLFEGAFHLESDTSVIRVDGTDVELYASPFDSEPVRRYPVPQLDSAVGASVLIDRDSAAKPFIAFATVKSTGSRSTQGWFTFTLWKLPFLIDSAFRTDTMQQLYRAETVNGAYDFPAGNLRSLKGAGVLTGCDGSELWRFELEDIPIYHGDLTQPVRSILALSLDRNGGFRTNGSGYRMNCAEVELSRDSSGRNIVVVFADYGDTVVLATPVASVRARTPQRRPHLVRFGDTLLLSWYTESATEILAFLSDGPSVAEPMDTLRLPPAASATKSDVWKVLKSGIVSSKHEATTAGKGLAVVDNRYLYADILYHPTSGVERLGSVNLDIAFATSTGWRQLHNDGWRTTFGVQVFAGELIGFNGAGDILLGLFPFYWQSGLELPGSLRENLAPGSIYRFSNDGNLLSFQENRSVTEPGFWIPLENTGEMLVVQHDRAIRLDGGVVASEFPLPVAEGRMRVIPFGTESFVRIRKSDSGRCVFELYDTSGTLLAGSTLPDMPEDILDENISILRRERDSALVVLWGTEDDGVHVALLDSRFGVVVADTVVSSYRGRAVNPAGRFHADTLMAVWEDYRNGEPDIYGNGILLPDAPPRTNTVESGSKSETATEAVVLPNPAGDHLELRFSEPLESAGSAMIVDAMGRPVYVKSLATGSVGSYLPLFGLPSGVYRLCWHVGKKNGTTPIVVAR